MPRPKAVARAARGENAIFIQRAQSISLGGSHGDVVFYIFVTGVACRAELFWPSTGRESTCRVVGLALAYIY